MRYKVFGSIDGIFHDVFIFSTWDKKKAIDKAIEIHKSYNTVVVRNISVDPVFKIGEKYGCRNFAED